MEKKQNNLIESGSRQDVLDFFKQEDLYDYAFLLLKGLVIKWKDDKEVLIEACKWVSIEDYIDKKLLKDKEFVLKIVERRGRFLGRLSNKFKKDEEIVKTAVRNDGRSLADMDASLKNNKEIFIIALNTYDSAMAYASPELKRDKELIEKSLNNNIESFRYIFIQEIDEAIIDRIIHKMRDKDARVISWFYKEFFNEEKNVDLLLGKLIDNNCTSMKKLGVDVKENILRNIAYCKEYREIIFSNYGDIFTAAVVPNVIEEIFLIKEKEFMLELLNSNKEDKEILKSKKIKF